MDEALSTDHSRLIPAGPDAPATALCPDCKQPVKLRRHQSTYYWRHVRVPRGGCTLSPVAAKPVANGDERDDRRDEADLLVEVAEQLKRSLHGFQGETHCLTLADVREMLENALAIARVRLVTYAKSA